MFHLAVAMAGKVLDIIGLPTFPHEGSVATYYGSNWPGSKPAVFSIVETKCAVVYG